MDLTSSKIKENDTEPTRVAARKKLTKSLEKMRYVLTEIKKRDDLNLGIKTRTVYDIAFGNLYMFGNQETFLKISDELNKMVEKLEEQYTIKKER